MEKKDPQDNFVRRRNKKLVTVVESTNNKKIKVNQNRAKSEEEKKIKSKKLLINSIEAINLITKGPSINKLFFKNDNISLKSESVPKSIKKTVKKYRSINIDKGKIAIYNNIKLQKVNDLNVKLSNNTVNNLNINTFEKSHELKGSTKEFYPFNENQLENKIKKPRKPNFINKNCISNDKLNIYNNQIKPNPIIEFYKPLKENEIKKNSIQKFQSVQQEKKFSKFSDCRIQKQLKEEDLNGSLDNINPDEFRKGNIQVISDNSYVENDMSSSLSSPDEDQNEEIQNDRPKNHKKEKIKNSNSINSKTMLSKAEKNSNKNVYSYNNELEENNFKYELNFFSSPQVYSNRTSNKSLKSDTKGDCFNNCMLGMNDLNNYNNIDNINRNYALENFINKNVIKPLVSINSNQDYDKENEEETEKLNKYNNFFEYPKNVPNNSIINDSFNNLKLQEQNKIFFNNEKSGNIKNVNYINDNNINSGFFYQNVIDKKSMDINNNNYSQRNNLDYNTLAKNTKNINTINIINNNLNNHKINNKAISLNDLVGNTNQSHIINIQNMNNFNNNNFILNPNQINPKNAPNNIMLDYNIHRAKSNNINESSYYIKNDLFDFNPNIRDNINPNLYININNNNSINDYNINQLPQQNYLINNSNNIDYINNINQKKTMINNQNYIPQNDIINNNSMNNNIFNFNNIYNSKQQNNNLYNNSFISNYSGYNNINNINQNINNTFPQNIQLNYNNKRKKQNQSNYYQNNNFGNNQNMNIPNNINFVINNQMNNYNYLNNNINTNNRNLNNNNYNFPILNNMNYPNINNSRFYNNQNQNLNNYQMIKGISYINNNNNNIIINNQNSTKKKRQNWNELSNEELAKQAYTIVKNQVGCRYLQKRVEANKELVVTVFFPPISGHFQELSNDQFGNYYIKIIIKYLPEDMIYKLISLIHPYFTKIGTNQYGTKVLQHLIEFLHNEKNLIFLIENIQPHIINLINDLNGIHIIQKLLLIKSQYMQLILNTIYNNIDLIAVTREGSNFIMKKLCDLLDEQNIIMLLNSINQKLEKIIIDQFGNFLIQNIIARFDIRINYPIIENITNNLVNFSNQKFSSNVVEKCFETEMQGNVIDEILKGNNYELILLNEYGNYVIQKAINTADKNKQQLLLKAFVPLIVKLQKKPFGPKLIQKLLKNYPKLSIFIFKS